MSRILDNLGTPLSPTWRARRRAPFTTRAIREELLRQSADLSDVDQAHYVDSRLTALDKALSGEEAEALEKWLLCEELLQGSAKTVDWDGGGGGGGRTSPVPDEAMEALAAHAKVKRRLDVRYRSALVMLAMMMQAGEWTLTDGFVRRVRGAASELTKLHSSLHT